MIAKYLCKLFGHKWHPDGYTGGESKGGGTSGFVAWSCLRCKAMYNEGFFLSDTLPMNEFIPRLLKSGVQPWITEEQKEKIHYEG